MSATYLGGTENSGVVTGLTLKSETYYEGTVKGEEISDYTLNYKSGSVESSTVYFYGASEYRASNAAVDIDTPMTMSALYKGDKNASVNTDEAALKSRTHYAGEKSEEYATYMQTFKLIADGTAIESVEGDDRFHTRCR